MEHNINVTFTLAIGDSKIVDLVQIKDSKGTSKAILLPTITLCFYHRQVI